MKKRRGIPLVAIILVVILIIILIVVLKNRNKTPSFEDNEPIYKTVSKKTEENLENTNIGITELKSSDESKYTIEYSEDNGIVVDYNFVDTNSELGTETKVSKYYNPEKISIEQLKKEYDEDYNYEFYNEFTIGKTVVTLYKNKWTPEGSSLHFVGGFVKDGQVFFIEHIAHFDGENTLPDGFWQMALKEIIENVYVSK